MAACAKAEAAQNRSFRGVVMTFRWTPDGHATDVHAKERPLQHGKLESCLAGVIGSLRLPRHNAAPRIIEYPIRVK
jgi:hypothetical protein